MANQSIMSEVLRSVEDDRLWDELCSKLEQLDYGDETAEITALARECLEQCVRPVDEISAAVRDGVDEAGSMTW